MLPIVLMLIPKMCLGLPKYFIENASFSSCFRALMCSFLPSEQHIINLQHENDGVVIRALFGVQTGFVAAFVKTLSRGLFQPIKSFIQLAYQIFFSVQIPCKSAVNSSFVELQIKSSQNGLQDQTRD